MDAPNPTEHHFVFYSRTLAIAVAAAAAIVGLAIAFPMAVALLATVVVLWAGPMLPWIFKRRP